MASFKLKLNGLPFGSQRFSYALNGDFFNRIEPTELRSARVEVDVDVTHEHEGLFQLEVSCSGTVVTTCDRCLDELELPIDTHYSVTVKQQGDEVDDSVDGVLTIPEGWNELDLAPIVRDTVLLDIPITHSHPEGECNEAMMELLGQHRATELAGSEEDDSDTQVSIDPRWEALRKLHEE